MSEQTPVITTHQQRQAAAKVTVYVEFGGQIAWLPRRMKVSQLEKKCLNYVSVEDDEDFIRPAREAAAKRDPSYTPEAMRWVQDCLTF